MNSEEIQRLVEDEEGATLVEYGLLVGLIAIVAIGAITLLGDEINAVFTSINNALSAAKANIAT